MFKIIAKNIWIKQCTTADHTGRNSLSNTMTYTIKAHMESKLQVAKGKKECLMIDSHYQDQHAAVHKIAISTGCSSKMQHLITIKNFNILNVFAQWACISCSDQSQLTHTENRNGGACFMVINTNTKTKISADSIKLLWIQNLTVWNITFTNIQHF